MGEAKLKKNAMIKDSLDIKVTSNKKKSELTNKTSYSYKEVYFIHPYENYYTMIYPFMDEPNAEKGDYKKSIDNHFETGRIDNEHKEDIYEVLQPENLIKSLIDKNSVRYKYKRKSSTGDMEWCYTTITVQRRENGRPACLIMAIRSVDEVLSFEEARKRDLQYALNEARKQNEAKSKFLSNISHDIRTPLNAILGYTQLAMEQANDPISINKMLEKISFSGSLLLRLINDVLDMSSIESGNLPIIENKNSLKKIILNSLSVVEGKIKEKNIDLNINVASIKNDIVYCDDLRLNQIFVNIITNAIKFSNPGGKLWFSVVESDTSENIKKAYEIRIRDNGTGMSKEFLKHVFEPFARERSAYAIPGTGLGLSIVKNLIDLMNGKVDVKSKKGVGTEFIINFVFKVDETKLEELNKECELIDISILDNTTALVIDDNPINIEIAVDLLESRGLKSISFDNARDGIDFLLRNSKCVDFVLMDIKMPGIDGYEATTRIKKKLPNIPVIGMSANAFKEDKDKGYAAGMDAYISKPLLIDDALQVIAKIITKKANC